MLRRKVPNVLPSRREVSIQVAAKESLDCDSEVLCISGRKDKSCPGVDNALLERAHIRSYHRQTEVIAKKQNAALKDVRIREHKRVGRLEIDFGFFVRNVFNACQDNRVESRIRNGAAHTLPVFVRPFL